MEDGPASLAEIRGLLAETPGTEACWAEVMHVGGMSLESIRVWLKAMAKDSGSPLRVAADEALEKEVSAMAVARGKGVGGNAQGLICVSVRTPLTQSEQTAVTVLTRGFCEARFLPSRRMADNSHARANAVRRCTGAYLNTLVPMGASVVEVGPNALSWVLDKTPEQWDGKYASSYRGAKPIMGPRDAVRASWAELVPAVLDAETNLFDETVKTKAGRAVDSYNGVFRTAMIEDAGLRGEYIKSVDANYDVCFDDMPKIMVTVGARAWVGVMTRAKGMTVQTVVKQGVLEHMGVAFSIDKKADRIDFRYMESHAFGYSHRFSEYCKYEQHNGFVWTTKKAHFVYSKLTESNDELLFFGVHRVASGLNLMEPSFAAHPWAGFVEITAPWAVGDEVDGVPRGFVEVVFRVDATNYARILEKRRCIDHKGDIMATIALVRSTNVKFWLSGQPVGATGRVPSKLTEALAVAIETIVSEDRQTAGYAFTLAEAAFREARLGNVAPLRNWAGVTAKPDVSLLCSAIMDMRQVTGNVRASISRVWQSVRATFIRAALSKVASMRVKVKYMDSVVEVQHGDERQLVDVEDAPMADALCVCGLRAQAQLALRYAEPDEHDEIKGYLASLPEECPDCFEARADFFSSLQSEATTTAVSEISEVFSDAGSESTVTSIDSSVDSTALLLSMQEFVAMENHKLHNLKTEVRISAARVFSYGYFDTRSLKEFSDSRTRHYLLKILNGRVVKKWGCDFDRVGAVYGFHEDKFFCVEGPPDGPMLVDAPDGLYYASSNMEVWITEELNAAVECAISTVSESKSYRTTAAITIGVPGAGKTRGLVKDLCASLAKGDNRTFRVLAMTRKSVEDAQAMALEMGMSQVLVDSCFRTVASYLINEKQPVARLFVDEFPMSHIGLTDAAVVLSKATEVSLFGDGKQVPWDTFSAGFPARFGSIRPSVKREQVKFLPETHRNAEDTCAMWVDQYPAYYPCECCGDPERKRRPTMSSHRVTTIAEVPFDAGARYHGYKKEDRDAIQAGLNMAGSLKALKTKSVGGLATVAEDQGSTHKKVITVRANVVWDKNASSRKPSLYNREAFVLTDTTRHKESYAYYSLCEENDLVFKRIAMSQDEDRIRAVREKRGLRFVDVMDLLG